jgi:hypothetical protein
MYFEYILPYLLQHTYERPKNTHKISAGNTEEKILLGRWRHTCDDIIKMYFKFRICEDVS